MGLRARGSTAIPAFVFEDDYGVPPADGFRKFPEASDGLGEQQGLIADDLIGFGRDPLAPGDDVRTNAGDIVVPVDARYVGLWLKLLFGAPTTTQGVAATGSLTFSAQPAANATITINSVAFTFKASPAGATDIQIGATLAETIRNAVWALNASANASVKVATYRSDLAGTKIEVTHDTLGTSGNAFTLAAGSSPASNATASGPTLSGGSSSGPYNHVFTAGGTLPSASIEYGHPEVPAYLMNYGIKANTLSIQQQRQGLLNMTLGLIAQGEDRQASSQAGTLEDEFVFKRFSQFVGAVRYLGVPLANVVSATLNTTNNLEPVDDIREDGRISGIDEGKLGVSSTIVARFADTVLLDVAESGTAIEVEFGWRNSASERLDFKITNLRLPKPKISRAGPGAIQNTYEGMGHRDATTGKTLIVTLINDVAEY